MNNFFLIIKETPLYVWVLLAYIMFVGIKAIKTRKFHLSKLFIKPLIIFCIKLKTFLLSDIIPFFSVLIVGTIGSFIAHGNTKPTIDKKAISVLIPGSFAPLIMFISFFCIKYYFGYLKFTAPEEAAAYAWIENIVGALFTAYFLGQSLRYLYQYYKA